MLHVLAYDIHVHQLIAPKNSPTHIPRINVAAAFLGTDGRSPCPQGGCTKTFANPHTAKKHCHRVPRHRWTESLSTRGMYQDIRRPTGREETLPQSSPRHTISMFIRR